MCERIMANAYHHHCPYFLLALLIVISSFSVASAATREYEIDTVKQSFLFLVDDFVFKETQANLELNISDLTFSDSNPNSFNLSQVGFFLSRYNRSATPTKWRSCHLHSPISSKLLYTLNDTKNSKADLHFTDIDGEAYYLYFENCITDKLNVSLNLRSSMYNLDLTTHNKCYLSFEKINLPMILSLYSLIYSSLALFWSYFLIYNKTKGRVVYRIHIFMVAVVFLKVLSIFLELFKNVYISHTGCAQCWTYIISNYTAVILGGTPLIMLMVLIFMGWSFTKPCIGYVDIALLVFVTACKLCLVSFKIYLVEDRGLDTFACSWCSGVLALGDVEFDAAFALLAMLSGIGFLHKAAKAHGKATTVLDKLAQFRGFFLVFFFYTVYTAFVVFWFETYADKPKYIWKSVFLKELGEVFLYVFIGYWFRPRVCNSRVLVADDIEKAASKSVDATDFVDYVGYIWGIKSIYVKSEVFV